MTNEILGVSILRRGRDTRDHSGHNLRGNAQGGYNKKLAFCKPGRQTSAETNSVGTLILNFYSPELWEDTLLLFKPPSLWYLVMAAQADSRTHLPILQRIQRDEWSHCDKARVKTHICSHTVLTSLSCCSWGVWKILGGNGRTSSGLLITMCPVLGRVSGPNIISLTYPTYVFSGEETCGTRVSQVIDHVRLKEKLVV